MAAPQLGQRTSSPGRRNSMSIGVNLPGGVPPVTSSLLEDADSTANRCRQMGRIWPKRALPNGSFVSTFGGDIWRKSFMGKELTDVSPCLTGIYLS